MGTAAYQGTEGRLAVRSFSPHALKSYVEAAGFVVLNQGYASYYRGSDLADTQFIVAAKEGSRHLYQDVHSDVRLNEIHIVPALLKTKTRQRKKMQEPCPGKSGEEPADYLCG